jgi:7,8-dihydro-6-hydroxymethylpterin-pyrophosphokinase
MMADISISIAKTVLRTAISDMLNRTEKIANAAIEAISRESPILLFSALYTMKQPPFLNLIIQQKKGGEAFDMLHCPYFNPDNP